MVLGFYTVEVWRNGWAMVVALIACFWNEMFMSEGSLSFFFEVRRICDEVNPAHVTLSPSWMQSQMRF